MDNIIPVNKKFLIIGAIIFLIIITGVAYKNPSNSENIIVASNTSNSNGTDYLSSLETSPANATYIVVGSSFIKVPSNATVVTQVDRVIKDVESNYNGNISPDTRPTSYKQLVPWMEGARVTELMKYANVTVIPATNVTIKKINNLYYGPNDKGNYIFEVDPSKLGTQFSQQINNDTWLMINTHGMNVLVPEAVKDHAYLTIACGDIPGKAQAEAYMAKKGINCYAPCDRFTSSIMPYKGPGVILGGEPIRKLNDGSGAVIGAQPLYFSPKEKIIVQTTTQKYPDQYCDTPFRFFTNLQKAYNITLNLDVVDANIGDAGKVVDEAQKTGANFIGVRVVTDRDKKPVEDWLNENQDHRAILFHSAAYQPGYSLFFEFPNQVTGQDPDPKFIKNVSNLYLEKILNQIRSLWQ